MPAPLPPQRPRQEANPVMPAPAPPAVHRPVTTVVGFDGALTSSGLAVWRDGRITMATIHTSAHDPMEVRWRQLCGQLWPVLSSHCLVLLEGVFKGARGRVALDLAMVHGVIRNGLHARAVPFAIADNTQIKQYATGNGSAGKEQMVDMARVRLGLQPGDSHQADAAWMAAMVLHRYGAPMCSTTKRQADVLGRIDWPQWTLDPSTLTGE
jgi:Holliday junction resolvasome RuvABC endonuclease subunit